MSVPRVQIVILNWNGYKDTIGCLASVFALEYRDFGVVVCDNGSTDGSLERIREWAAQGDLVSTSGDDHELPKRAITGGPIHFVEYDRETAETGGLGDTHERLALIRNGKNLGFAGGTNVGLRYLLARANAEYVWLLNNDTVVAPSALRELVDRAEADSLCGAVGGTLFEQREPDRVQEMGGATVSSWHGMVKVLGRGLPASDPRPRELELDYVSGGCVLVRSEVLTRVGLLDERFFIYGEDVDWGLRMRQAGLRLLYAPAAHIWHQGSASSMRASPTHDYHNIRGSLLLIHKHHPSRLPVAMAYSIYRCFLPKAVRREWSRLAAVARAYRDVLRQIRQTTRPVEVKSAGSLRAPEQHQSLPSGIAS